MADVRVLAEDEYRRAHTLFRAAMHASPSDDEHWERVKGQFLPGRTFGALDGDRVVGVTHSFPMDMVVPGGATLPHAAVTRVGVRADHTRRGLLTALMRDQLAALAAAGEPLATLRASEYRIYGRFGYGVASHGRSFDVDPRRGAFHPGAPAAGSVRLLEPDEVETVLPALYRRIDERRPGTLQRSDVYWTGIFARLKGGDHPVNVAVHTGPDGDDGYAWYSAGKPPPPQEPWPPRLGVDDLHAASVEATAGLWRFLLGVDISSAVHGWMRPLDEPVELLLEDARACRTTEIDDEIWLRLVDVDTTLSARAWGSADSVVIGVRDDLLPANTGSWLITPDGAKRTDDEPHLTMSVATLARLYLGDVTASALATTGWITAHTPAALPAADALFATGIAPWAGTFF